MRPLGVSTRALIAELYDGGVSQQPGPRSVLAMVAASREPAAVLELVPLLLKGGAVADEVARAMAEILTDQPARVFAQLEAVRSQGGCECCRWGQWTTLRPDDVSAIARLSHAWAPLGIMSYHPSGFVREAAVRALARRTDGREVPFLVLRVNDWVAEVRAVALAAQETVNAAPRQYLNRLSDLMFVLARVLNRANLDGKGGDDVYWRSEKLAREQQDEQ